MKYMIFALVLIFSSCVTLPSEKSKADISQILKEGRSCDEDQLSRMRKLDPMTPGPEQLEEALKIRCAELVDIFAGHVAPANKERELVSSFLISLKAELVSQLPLGIADPRARIIRRYKKIFQCSSPFPEDCELSHQLEQVPLKPLVAINDYTPSPTSYNSETHCDNPAKEDPWDCRCKPVEELKSLSCKTKTNIFRLKVGNSHEKEISKESGVLNAGAVYSNTQSLLGEKDLLRELGKWYRKKTGKPLDLKDCPPDTF